MKSKWFQLKEQALRLRTEGVSVRSIELKLGIPRSTLSGWFKNVILSDSQYAKLQKNHKLALINARKEAVKWHNQQKQDRISVAGQQAEEIYKVPIEKIKCELHLRADQNPVSLQRYWSRTLNIPLKNFTSVSIDQRSAGKPTFAHYKGVCVVRCGHGAIQRKLMFISKLFCEQIINKGV